MALICLHGILPDQDRQAEIDRLIGKDGFARQDPTLVSSQERNGAGVGGAR